MNLGTNRTQITSIFSGKTLGICLLITVVIIAAIVQFKIPLSTLVFAALLLVCPLAHVFLMRDGKHKH